MSVHKPFAPVPPDLQELYDSAVRTSRTLRQVLEQDGLTEQVLNLDLPRLGELIDIYELWESLIEDAKAADFDPSVIIEILWKIRERMESRLITFQPWADWLQGFADQFYDGSKLSGDILRRMRGQIRRDHPAVSSTDANALPLPVAYELLAWNVANPVVPEATSDPAENPRSIEDSLTLNDRKILGAMAFLKAIDRSRATSRSEIIKQAKNGNHTSNHNEESFERLIQLSLIASVRNVGTWLTQAGIELARNKRQ